MLNIILWFLLIFLVLLILIFIAPLGYRIIFDYSEEKKIYKVKLYFLGIKVYTIDNKSDKIEVEKSKKEQNAIKEKVKPKEEAGKDKNNFSLFIKFIRENEIKEYLAEAWILIKSIFSQLLPRDYQINLKAGFADPYYTGNLAALYYSLDGLIRRDRIKLNLYWNKEVFAAQGYIYGRLMLAPICFYFLRFIVRSGLYKVLFKKLRGRLKNGYDRKRTGDNV
ncbi:MAG: hypothetical protein ACOCWE_02975 [Bacillota bacterium]